MIFELISNAIASFVGLISLWIKFRGKKSIKELRKEAEDESFTFEGWKVIITVLVTMILIPLIAVICMLIYRIIRGL
jgi:uncharacterized membrane protein